MQTRCRGLEVLASRAHDESTVRLRGEADLAVSEFLYDQLAAEVFACKSVLIDATELSLLDSSCIRSLLRANALAVRSGRGLRVTDASPIVRRTLEVVHVAVDLGLNEPDAGPQ